MDGNLRLRPVPHRFGDTRVDAMLVDVTGDGDQIGEHGVADGGGNGEVAQGIQADVNDPRALDDIQPFEDRAGYPSCPRSLARSTRRSVQK